MEYSLEIISKDLKGVSSIVVLLSDRTAPLREPNRDLNIPPLSPLASVFVEKTNSETSVKHLIEVSGPNTSFCSAANSLEGRISAPC